MPLALTDSAGVVLIALILVFAILANVWHYSRANDMLESWGRDNHHEIVSSRRCWFWKGPFFWSSKGQEVYRVTMRTPEGRVRHGWVRCGSWLFGVLSDDVEVSWDDW